MPASSLVDNSLVTAKLGSDLKSMLRYQADSPRHLRSEVPLLTPQQPMPS